MKALLLLVVAPLLVMSGCGVFITGDFQGIPFTPDENLVAVADQNDLLQRNGAVVPVTRPDGQQRLHLLLTSANVNVNDDWRRYDTDKLLEIKRELATEDSLLLKDIALDRFGAGDTLDALVENGVQSGDFQVFMGAALPPESGVEAQGLGSKVRARITPKSLVVDGREGSFSLSVSLQREREAGQDGDVATGEVVIDFGGSLLPERLTESNLTVAEPVVACVFARGPSSGGGCRDVDALPYVDETGLVP
jgi:hypothetical protein